MTFNGKKTYKSTIFQSFAGSLQVHILQFLFMHNQKKNERRNKIKALIEAVRLNRGVYSENMTWNLSKNTSNIPQEKD